MQSSAPITVLVVLGVLITILGLFAAGELALVALGLTAVLAAGLLGVAVDRKAA